MISKSVLHLFPGVPQDFEAVRVFEAIRVFEAVKENLHTQKTPGFLLGFLFNYFKLNFFVFIFLFKYS